MVPNTFIMKLYSIKEQDFLQWFFNAGDDQSQKQERFNIGQQMIDELLLCGSGIITSQEIWDKCEKTVIPLRFITEFDDNADGEFGDLEEECDLVLTRRIGGSDESIS